MRKTLIHILVVAVLALSACSNGDIEPNAVSDCPTFSASIDGSHSRAADNYWENGDKIGISGGNYSNICYVTEIGDGNFTVEDPDRQIYYQGPSEVTFTAYYPYSSSLDASTGLISTSTTDQTNRKDFDFLWAQAVGSKNLPDVKFTFKHKMSKVTFVFKNGENMDVRAINKIRLNGLVMEGTFDTTTDSCKVSEETPAAPVTVDLTDVRTDEPVTPLFLIPQSVAGKLKLEIYADNSQYFVCMLEVPDNELLAGTNYTYTITVNKTGLQVTEATLSDWIVEEDKSDASSADD